MEISINSIAEQTDANATTSPWNTIVMEWSNDLGSLMSNPSLRENLWGQIEALGPIAAKSGSQLFANLFIVFTKDYQTFLANPNSTTLATITTDINGKLMAAAPQNPSSYNTALADQTLELLLYKINPYNPSMNVDEIQGMLSAIQLFMPQYLQSQCSQMLKDCSNYLKYHDETDLSYTQVDINGLIAALQ